MLLNSLVQHCSFDAAILMPENLVHSFLLLHRILLHEHTTLPGSIPPWQARGQSPGFAVINSAAMQVAPRGMCKSLHTVLKLQHAAESPGGPGKAQGVGAAPECPIHQVWEWEEGLVICISINFPGDADGLVCGPHFENHHLSPEVELSDHKTHCVLLDWKRPSCF